MDKGEKVLVALSGGADSVALLLSLHILGYDCAALHCNFHLRGEDSNQDESFCRTLCKQYNIPLWVEECPTQEYATQKGISIEMAARDLRYKAFDEKAKTLDIKTIAIAHHLKDNIETLIAHLASGTGLKGLRGIPIKRDNIVRPLLETNPKEIYSFLELIGAKYRTDQTNNDTSIRRNYIRHTILPLFEHLNPNFINSSQHVFDNLREAEHLYTNAIEQAVSRAKVIPEVAFDETEYYNCEKIVASGAPLTLLHHLLTPLGFQREDLELFALHLRNKESATILSNSHTATRAFGQLIITRKKIDSPLRSPIALTFTHREGIITTPIGTLSYRFTSSTDCTYQPYRIYVDVSDFQKEHSAILEGTISIPDMQQKITPFGMKGSKTVNNVLKDKKVLPMHRKQTPLLSIEGTPIWLIPFVRTSARMVTTQSTKILILEWQPR